MDWSSQPVIVRARTPEHIEHRLERPDGRVVAVAEWGDPDGVPYIAHHGTPGGRISYWRDPTIYARMGLRRITYDRAGYGDSTRQPGRSVADVVPDIEAIADALGLERFVVMGGSGGGPHALATAALLPDRVIRCLAAVSPAPWEADFDHFAGMNAGNVEEYEAAVRGESAHRPIAEREAATALERLRSGRADWLGDGYEMSESDRDELGQDLAGALDEMDNAIGRSVDGWVDDMLASVKPWGFDLGAIRCRVRLDYGRKDAFVPPANGDWLVANVPGAEAFITDAGHLGSEELLEDVLNWVRDGPGGAAA
jgi:pimeloyl-ACP methyl ester carboxylesterase